MQEINAAVSLNPFLIAPEESSCSANASSNSFLTISMPEEKCEDPKSHREKENNALFLKNRPSASLFEDKVSIIPGGMLAQFYHGSFEFYGPYNRGLLVDTSGYPLLSVDEWRDLLALVNGPTIAEDVPQKLKFFRKLACLAFSLLLCGIGFLLFIPLWITAKSYERAFVAYALRVRMFLDACTEGFSKRGLSFKLVRASNPQMLADVESDPYDLCISVTMVGLPSKRIGIVNL